METGLSSPAHREDESERLPDREAHSIIGPEGDTMAARCNYDGNRYQRSVDHERCSVIVPGVNWEPKALQPTFSTN